VHLVINRVIEGYAISFQVETGGMSVIDIGPLTLTRQHEAMGLLNIAMQAQ